MTYKKGHITSDETRKKIGLANRGIRIEFICDNCGKLCEEKQSHYKRKKRHFCNIGCYSDFRKTKLPLEEQHAYKGIRKAGDSKQVYHRRYVNDNREYVNDLKLRHYARKKGAEGNHTLEDWKELQKMYGYKCIGCGDTKKLTKDHVVPLSKGGSNYIENIQPLCRNCNSRKHNKLDYQFQNPELLKS